MRGVQAPSPLSAADPTVLSVDSPGAATALDRPLRILHYLPEIRLEDGGVVRAVLDWCAVFADRGHQMSLVTCQDKDVPRDWLTDNPRRPRAHLIPAMVTPLRLMQKNSQTLIIDLLKRTDVLHLHGPWFPGNRRIAALAGQLGVPYVVTVHGMLDDWSMSQKAWKKKLFLTLGGGRFLRQARCMHCTAEGELSQARKWFVNDAATVLPYLVDLTAFENLPGPDAARTLIPTARHGDPKLLFLSRVHEKKGVDVLIRAAAIMRDTGLQFTVMIAGTGDPLYVQEMYKLAAELNLRDRVFFIGLVTGSQKIAVYQFADLFVLPTAQENFGLVLTEAMACGTPVLTTKGTDIWLEVQNAGGEITDRTPEAIAAAAMKLLGDTADRKVRSARGRDWVFSNLAVEPLSKRYEALYRELAGKV